MGKAKRRKKKKAGTKLRFRFTPSAAVGMVLSVSIVAAGLYGALAQASPGALYFVVLGAVMAAIVVWRSVYRK